MPRMRFHPLKWLLMVMLTTTVLACQGLISLPAQPTSGKISSSSESPTPDSSPTFIPATPPPESKNSMSTTQTTERPLVVYYGGKGGKGCWPNLLSLNLAAVLPKTTTEISLAYRLETEDGRLLNQGLIPLEEINDQVFRLSAKLDDLAGDILKGQSGILKYAFLARHDDGTTTRRPAGEEWFRIVIKPCSQKVAQEEGQQGTPSGSSGAAAGGSAGGASSGSASGGSAGGSTGGSSGSASGGSSGGTSSGSAGSSTGGTAGSSGGAGSSTGGNASGGSTAGGTYSGSTTGGGSLSLNCALTLQGVYCSPSPAVSGVRLAPNVPSGSLSLIHI